MLRKGHGGLCKAPTKEESEKLRGERDQIKFIRLRFERWQRNILMEYSGENTETSTLVSLDIDRQK